MIRLPAGGVAWAGSLDARTVDELFQEGWHSLGQQIRREYLVRNSARVARAAPGGPAQMLSLFEAARVDYLTQLFSGGAS